MKKLLSYFFLIFPLSLMAQFSGNGPLGPTNGLWYWGTNVSGVQGRGMLNTNFLYIKDRLVDTNVLAERAWVTNRETIINVKDFGATGDGTTDDTAAIQAAMAYAQQDSSETETSIRVATNRTRGWVYLPAGTYSITSPLTISNDNFVMRGAGEWRSIIKPGAGVSGIRTTNAPRHCVLEDFSVVGASATPTVGTVGIDLIGTDTHSQGGAVYIGMWSIHNVNTVYFDVGLRGNKLQDSQLHMQNYHCNTGVVLTNEIHGVEYIGGSRFNNTNNFTLGGLSRCDIWALDCDLATNTTATNVFRIVGAVEYSNIRGRSEIHAPGVRVFDFQSGEIVYLTLDNYNIKAFPGGEGWSLFFSDNYPVTNGATVRLEGGTLSITNASVGGAVRMPAGVKLLTVGAQSPLISGFTNGVLYTNYYGGGDVEIQDGGRRGSPASFAALAHQPFFHRPSATGEETWNVALYTTNGVLTNVPITEPWQKIRDGIVPEVGDTLVSWTGTHAFGALSNRIRLNVTNTSVINYPVVGITSENVGGNNSWQIVASDSSANATAKTMRVGGLNFHPSMNPVTLMLMTQGSSNRATISYGGGTSVGSPANDHVFYSGLQSTNGGGAVVARIWDSGGFSVGSTVTAPTDPGDNNIRAEGNLIMGVYGTASNHAVSFSQLTTVSNLLDGKLNISGGNADAIFAIHNMGWNSGDNTVTLSGGATFNLYGSGGIIFDNGVDPAHGIYENGSGFYFSDDVSAKMYYTGRQIYFTNGAPRSATAPTHAQDLVRLGDILSGKRETWMLYASEATNSATVGTNLVMIVPFNCSIETNNAMISFNRHIVGTGSQTRLEICTNGVSIMSTPFHIDAGESNSLSAATNFVFSTTNLLRGSYLEVKTLQVGATIPGSGLHVALPIKETP